MTKSRQILIIAGSILGLAILIAGGLTMRSRWVYKECLKTWPSAQSQAVIKSYRLTKEDFCGMGYTLSAYFSLRESIAEKIRSREDYHLRTAVGTERSETERTKYFNREFKSRMREIIKPEEIESPFD